MVQIAVGIVFARIACPLHVSMRDLSFIESPWESDIFEPFRIIGEAVAGPSSL